MTKNIMNFKNIVVNNVCYGENRDSKMGSVLFLVIQRPSIPLPVIKNKAGKPGNK